MKDETGHYRRIEDLSDEEIYQVMDSSDKIEGGIWCNYPSDVYIALDCLHRIIAAGSYDVCSANSVYHKSISRRCLTPNIYQASRVLKPEMIKMHNSLLEKALLAKFFSKATQKG